MKFEKMFSPLNLLPILLLNMAPLLSAHPTPSPPDLTLTWRQLTTAVTLSYPLDYPTRLQHQTLLTFLSSSGFRSRLELAMFLAQILYESGGLAYKEEIACSGSGNSCNGVYDSSVGLPGKSYHGRGYIQLTHSYNYRSASLALFNDLRLISSPELVATNETLAWQTAFWFWNTFVHSRPLVVQGAFGDTTRAINGLECGHGVDERAKRRFQVYEGVLVALGMNGVQAIEEGCY